MVPFESKGNWTKERESWGSAFLGALPFLLFGLAYILKGLAELGVLGDLDPWWPDLVKYGPPVVYLIVTVLLLLGWLRGLPRWSYAYLGMALYFGWYYSNGRFYGVVYGWQAWIPVVLAMLVPLAITRSLRPLAALAQGAWNEWTRLSFTLYAFALPTLTVIFFDMDWGTFELFGLGFDTLMLAAGAVTFLRSRTTWWRAVWIQTPMFILVFKGVTLGDWYPYFILLLWPFLLLPSLVGLLRHGVLSFSTH